MRAPIDGQDVEGSPMGPPYFTSAALGNTRPVAPGEAARAVFYFLLRYPGLINRTTRELDEDRLAVLLEWHESFPVSIYEHHRNARIQARQGNRNPFVDNPALPPRLLWRRVSGERVPVRVPQPCCRKVLRRPRRACRFKR